MNIAPRERGPRRLPPAATEFLAWTGALAYPVLLCVTAMDEREPTGVRLLPFAALAVLTLPLVRRRPLPALLLILAGSFPAVVTFASAAARQPFMPGFEGPGWQLATLQALLSYAVVGRIAAGQGARRAPRRPPCSRSAPMSPSSATTAPVRTTTSPP